MKKLSVLVIVLLLTAACGANVIQTESGENPPRYLGVYEMRETLDHDQRYADGAFIYIPDADAVEVFKAVTNPVIFKVFYRTDCGDSVREVPRFIKTLQLADNDNFKVEMVGVNVAKTQPAELLKGWGIKFVPTFVVLHDGQEVGRVIERAEENIEIDLSKILKKILVED
jgi:thiol-disulfide isomerase/thioredoxin